jgi:hypothetical protein
MRKDYKVLWWMPDNGPWGPAAEEQYVSEGYEGVFWRLPRSSKNVTVDALLNLPRLRFVEIQGPVVDDTPLFTVPTVEELILLTRNRQPVPDIASTSRLGRLGIDDRPRLDGLRAAPALRELLVWGWRGTDFGFVSPDLTNLTMEGTRRVVSLSGLDQCHHLSRIRLTGTRVESLRPLAGLGHLRSIEIIGHYRITEHVQLDLADLRLLSNLEVLTVTYGGTIRSLAPLTEMPNLREVRLRGTTIADGDLTPLDALSEHATVVGPDE